MSLVKDEREEEKKNIFLSEFDVVFFDECDYISSKICVCL